MGTLLKASVGVGSFDEEWHPVNAQDATSAENIAVLARMFRRDTINLLHEGPSVEFARVSRLVPCDLTIFSHTSSLPNFLLIFTRSG